MNKPRILECTLRDGSYAINFQFTKEDTITIASALEELGFDMIEIGHGVGLGASENGKGVAAETDEVYLQAGAEAIKNADWGMFCIPGIAELRHIDMAAEYGMKFIRIGTNISDYEDSKPFIEKAKKHNMFVCSNFMKSYASKPEVFAKNASEVKKYGSDLIYIVDSAGGMLPEEVEKYILAVKDNTDSLRLGFHGHNNLGLGIANALVATELGVDVIDTSLQGFGRSAGNTSTEQFLSILMRKGIDMDIDPISVMSVSEKYIYPIIQKKGLNSVDMISGLALFHSSYLPIIEEYALKYRIDPLKLIVAVSEKNKVEAKPELVEEIAMKLSDQGAHGSWKPLYSHYIGGEQD